jgi:hypothetical protein
VAAVAPYPSTTSFACVTNDGTFKVVDAVSGKLIAHRSFPTALKDVVIVNDESVAIVACDDGYIRFLNNAQKPFVIARARLFSASASKVSPHSLLSIDPPPP